MLLRASSEKQGSEADLEGAIGEGDGGVPHGGELIRFGEAVTRGGDDIASARDALIGGVGRDGFIDAAGIVGVFNGLVRTADSSGIPLDDGTRDRTVDFRASLGLDQFGGASNTPTATNENPGASAAEAGGVASAFR